MSGEKNFKNFVKSFQRALWIVNKRFAVQVKQVDIAINMNHIYESYSFFLRNVSIINLSLIKNIFRNNFKSKLLS